MTYTYIFESRLFQAMAVQQRQHVYAVGCLTCYGRLIDIFVFDILQIPSGCKQICYTSGGAEGQFNSEPQPCMQVTDQLHATVALPPKNDPGF